jgi:hypothetical protein
MDAAGGKILVDLNDYQRARIIHRLTFANPAYTKAVALDQPTQGLSETILGYKEHNGALIVPKHFEDVPYDCIERVPSQPSCFAKAILSSPRAGQLNVVQELSTALVDIGLSLPCGFGKTFLALHYASRFPGRVLVVCPTTVKLEEWQTEIVKHMDLSPEQVGRVQASTREYLDYPITVTMLKTLATQEFPREFLCGFDLIIWDEAHLCGAPVLSRALGRVQGVNLTLTATPGTGVRRKLIELHNGSNWVTELDIVPIPVSAYFVRVPVSNYIKSLDWRFQKIKLARTPAYTEVAAGHIAHAMEKQRRVLVLNSQISPLVYLSKQFPGGGFIVGSGSLKEVAQNKIKQLYPDKTWKECVSSYIDHVKQSCNPILATGLTKTQPGGVGMDVSNLDAGVVMFPVSCPDMTQQLLGRWQRYHPEKKNPILIVMVPRTDIAEAIAKKMAAKLTSLGVTVNF